MLNAKHNYVKILCLQMIQIVKKQKLDVHQMVNIVFLELHVLLLINMVVLHNIMVHYVNGFHQHQLVY